MVRASWSVVNHAGSFKVVLFSVALCLTCAPLEAQTRVASDFPSLIDAASKLTDTTANTAGVIIGKTAIPLGSPAAMIQLPPKTPVLAFEENSRFLCVTVDLSELLSSSVDTPSTQHSPTFIRRVIFLKPAVWVIQNSINPKACASPPHWEVQQDKAPSAEAGVARKEAWSIAAAQSSAADANNFSTCTCVVQAGSGKNDAVRTTTTVKNHDGRADVTVATADRVYRLQLPAMQIGDGRIAVDAADGKTLVARRPLPAGVLPHGDKGMQLIERWDKAYRDGRQPPWNSGTAAPDLKKAVENGDIKPCRVVVLGCGSGTNAIFLAKNGFDVTAIDVAPTALGIAEAKAQKAHVKVRWLLADVLALPELGPFDLIFDRGCYHNVRYVDAKGFVNSLDQLSRPGTRFLVLSCDRDSAPGVREPTMRTDFSPLFDFKWIRHSTIVTGAGGQKKHASWSVMLKKKG